MRVMLTGATGFLGSYVAQALVAQGHDVIALVRDPTSLNYLEASTLSKGVTVATIDAGYGNLPALVGEHMPDVVIHIASMSRGGERDADIRGYVDANILFGSLLLNAMRAHGISAFVNCGTSWQSDADGKYSPFNFYAGTKQALEDILAYYCIDGMKAITLRVFDTFGPRDERNRVVDLIIGATRASEPLAMSPGAQHVELVDVRDAADAFVVAATRVVDLPAAANEVYGVTTGRSVQLRELARIVGDAVGAEPKIDWGGRSYRPREIMFPCTALAKLPGWEPYRQLPETVAEIVSESVN